MQKEYKLTLLEHEVLSYLANKQYLYIARDEDGDLFVYKEKPIKNLNYWNADRCNQLIYFENKFNFIQWEDNEPVLIQNILNSQHTVEEKYLEKALEMVISDCDECDIGWFDQIADIDATDQLLRDCTDEFGWLKGIKEYYLIKAGKRNAQD
ncbi:MAG TPA: hypothetical protein OIL95_13805 [Coprobacillaceae bacterium]|nr:hypothetical protein [Coprobacillaceae bacterium]